MVKNDPGASKKSERVKNGTAAATEISFVKSVEFASLVAHKLEELNEKLYAITINCSLGESLFIGDARQGGSSGGGLKCTIQHTGFAAAASVCVDGDGTMSWLTADV